MAKKRKSISNNNRRVFYILGACLIVIIAIAIFLILGHRKSTVISSSSSLNNPYPRSSPAQSSATKGNAQSFGSSSSSSTSTATTQSSQAPIKPYGDFVSNHHPGGSAPTSESSVCNTTPGAICTIEFSKGNEAKKLDSLTTNQSGAAIWYWDVNKSGLDPGLWTISAVASLNGKTATSIDVQPLVVE